MMKSKLLLLMGVLFLGNAAAADRYEAENAIVDINTVQKVDSSGVSGGSYVNMKSGSLSFSVTVGSAGFYTLWTSYSEPYDSGGKIQNLSINGISAGQISFPYKNSFVYLKACSKIKLTAGVNVIAILNSWGWVKIDYIEIAPFTATPFTISASLVTPNPSVNVQKMYSFIRSNFQIKVISGAMTNTVMQNDGKYTPDTVENQTEVAWIINACGKTPALLGVDFMHSTGKNSENEWYKGYTNATVALARDIYKKGGFPAYCWHWKDPSDSVEAFYSPSSGNSSYTTFNLNRAFTDSTTYSAFNTNSNEYKCILRDLDTVAGYLKSLANAGIPVIWRPLHEASGKWFWWGYKGPGACKALYRLMFDRFTNYHSLNNLIWVWVTDEAANATDWYPGDAYVDIITRDYYYYPRIANHGSLMASFENVKELFGGRKIISLGECGSIPYPNSMKADGAGWSYFMPWYGDYTMDGWAHDNTAADWNSIMNNNYVITLDKMPGWANYNPSAVLQQSRVESTEHVSLRSVNGFLELAPSAGQNALAVEFFNLQGMRTTTLNKPALAAGTYRFSLDGIAKGMYIARIKMLNAVQVAAQPILLK